MPAAIYHRLHILFFVIAIVGCAPVSAAERIIALNSREGRDIFAQADAKTDFFALINHFESQKNGIYCGAASAAIILNTLRLPISGDIEHPPLSLGLTAQENAVIPESVRPHLQRYTQRNIFGREGTKSVYDVLGRGNVPDLGFQLRQLGVLLQAHGLHVDIVPSLPSVSAQQLTKRLKRNLQASDNFILVNYRRDALGQQGGGHISPLGAYDSVSDRFLILDVNPTRAPFIWVKATDLHRAMLTFDTLEYRGYLNISR